MRKFLLFLLITVQSVNLFAQNPADIDLTMPGYANEGYQNTTAIALQQDNKILVGRLFENEQPLLSRLNNDGTKDTSFNINAQFNGFIDSIVVQPDGKILVGGTFTAFNGNSQNCLIRLNSDGTIDTSFNIGTGFDIAVTRMALQSDGKILVGGHFTSFNGVTQNRLIRLNTDGSKDPSFNVGTGFDGYVLSIVIQQNSKILVGGDFTTFNGVNKNSLIRLNTDGTQDTSFNIGTGFDSVVSSTAIQPDGKILVGGNFTSFNGVVQNRLVRLNNDGSKDSSFNIGTGFEDPVQSIAVQSDGRILVGGVFETFNGNSQNCLVRLNNNGTKHLSFNIGSGFNTYVLAIALQSDDKILVGGTFTSFDGDSQNGLIRLHQYGVKDADFYFGIGFSYLINSIALQQDGKIISGGGFNSFQGITQKRLIRLNEDVTKDTNFNIGTGFDYGVYSTAVQPDGKILVGGDFTTFNGNTQNGLIRLNTNGSKDTSFDIGTGFNGNVSSIVIQPDGKILVSGAFIDFNGSTQNSLIRLNADGTKDTSFNIGTGFNDFVLSIAIQSDGKVLAGGSFTTFNGNNQNNLIRLNTDGSKDTSFDVGTGFTEGDYSHIGSIAIQSDGKVLVGGNFTMFNGNNQNDLIRLNTDGSKDLSFDIGTGFAGGTYSGISSIAIQSDGKILAGGRFSIFNGNTQNCLVRLNVDGTKDTSFNVGTGFDNNVYTIVIQSDNKILVGGLFNFYNGINSTSFIRLKGDSVFLTANDFSKNKITLYPNPTQNILNFTLPDTGTATEFEINNLLGNSVKKGVLKSNSISVDNLANGIYIVKIKTNRGIFTEKFIKE